MALTNIQLVRFSIGDTVLPYKLSDAEITDYLAIYSNDVEDTVVALKKIMLATLAVNSGQEVIGDFEHDTRDAPKAYLEAMKYIKLLEEQNSPASKYGYPIIGGTAISDSIKIGIYSDLEYEES